MPKGKLKTTAKTLYKRYSFVKDKMLNTTERITIKNAIRKTINIASPKSPQFLLAKQKLKESNRRVVRKNLIRIMC